jgi:hypothetical protein
MKASKTTGAAKSALKTRTSHKPTSGSSKGDPRTSPPPTAPPSVSAGALKSLATVSEAATLEPRRAAKPVKAQPKPRTVKPGVKAETAKPPAAASGTAKVESMRTHEPSAAKPAPAAPQPASESIDSAAKPRLSLVSDTPSNGPEAKVRASLPTVVETGTEQAHAALTQARETNDTLRNAMALSATAATRGLVELNGKMLDLMRAQSQANFATWRSTLTAGSLSEAIKAQTAGIREAYETTATQWKEVADATARLMGDAAKPLQSALTKPGR